MENLRTFLLAVILCVELVLSAPISVPVDNNYQLQVQPSYNSHQNFYDDTSARRPNAYFNRLPPYSNQVQTDDVSGINTNAEDDYDDQQLDKPVIGSSSQQSSNSPSNNYNNLYSNQNYNNPSNSNNFLLSDVSYKKKRVRRPCIPIQSLGSPLFSNRVKREVNYNAESGKTLNLLGGFGNYLSPYYQSNYQSNYQTPTQFDNVKPQYDTPGQVQYQPYGGYPCVPVSLGTKPGSGLFGGSSLFDGSLFDGSLLDGSLFGGSGLFGGLQSPGLLGSLQSPGILGSGGGSSGGPLGIFGQGGLLDFGSPGPLAPAGVYQGTGNYPQTVIINRPPLFGNLGNFGGNGGSNGGSNGGYRPPGSGADQFSSSSNNRPGFWNNVVNKLSDFV